MTAIVRRHIVPSLLSADFGHLARDVRRIQEAGAQSVHFDVMDGHFVPNITVGPVVLQALRKETPLFLDVHLMIENPEKYIEAFAKAGANSLTVHWEACRDALSVVRQIKNLHMKAAVAIRPKTSEEVLYPLLKEIDMALVMTVEPGFGGQAFMPAMLEKVERLRERIEKQQLSCVIQVDGGIDENTAPQAVEAGAASLVAGNAVFGAPDAAKAFKELQQLVDFPSKTQVK